MNRQALIEVVHDPFPGTGNYYQYECYQQLKQLNKTYMSDTITTIADKLTADAKLELQNKVNAKLDFCVVDPHDGLSIPQTIDLKVTASAIHAASLTTPDADNNVVISVPLARFYADINKAMYELNEVEAINKKHSEFLQKVEEKYPFVKP